jgi:hypothetical protein
MIENFLMGAGAKMANNLVMGWLENSAEERKANAMKDAEVIRANVELVRETNKNHIASLSRALIFTLLTLAWCWMGIAGYMGLGGHAVETTALVPQSHGLFSRLFNQTELAPIPMKGTIPIYQWYQIMEMMMGAFVMPSRKSH